MVSIPSLLRSKVGLGLGYSGDAEGCSRHIVIQAVTFFE